MTAIDATEFGAWYQASWPAAKALAARLLGDRETAEDSASEVLRVDDQTAAQTARRLGIRPTSVRSRVLRARRRLAHAS